MNKNFLRSLSALCLFFSCYSSAQWVEVTGEAVILESEETARVNALEDAVYQAMKHAGGEIATLPSLKPYFAEPKQQYRFSGN